MSPRITSCHSLLLPDSRLQQLSGGGAPTSRRDLRFASPRGRCLLLLLATGKKGEGDRGAALTSYSSSTWYYQPLRNGVVGWG
jgi:hypothetical protein